MYISTVIGLINSTTTIKYNSIQNMKPGVIVYTYLCPWKVEAVDPYLVAWATQDCLKQNKTQKKQTKNPNM